MIRRLMASTAVLALLTAGGFGVAQAQTEPAEQPPPAVQQDATGADQGAAPAADAAATAEEPAPAAEAADATTAEEPADAAATAEAPAEEPADASATADAAAEQPADATATAETSSEETLQPEEPTIATAFMGQSVFSSEDPESDNIGDVKDLIISQEGMITHAVVGVGGFLGIGEKEVAVPFDELQVVEDENGEIRLIYAATREQLEAAEEFDRTAFDPERRAAEEQQAAAQAGADPAAGGLAPAGGIAPAPAPDMAAAPEPVEEPADMTAAEPAEQPAEGEAAESTDMAAAPEPTEQPAEGEAATDTEMAAAEPAEQPPAGEATTETETVAVETVEEPAEATTATETEIAEFDPQSGFLSYDANQQLASTGVAGTASVQGEDISAENLIGMEIFGAGDESVGEVGDVILAEGGTIEAVVVDVGGFLGVGEKPVAIQFDALNVQKDTNGDLRLMVNATQEQLEAAPAYEVEEQTVQ